MPTPRYGKGDKGRTSRIEADPRNELAILLARDLSTLTRLEIELRWGQSERAAAEASLNKPWTEIVPAEHNPIYYLATKCFFDNKITNPRYLYAPYHRDRFCAPVLDYVLDPAPAEVGMWWGGPRDTYKSTFVGVVALWYALRRYHLDREFARIVLRHHKEDLASANLVRVRAKVWKHPWFRWAWEECAPPLDVREFGTLSEFSFASMPETGDMAEQMFRSMGAKSSDTGTHCDLDLGDDLVNEEHITSRRVREDARLRYAARRYTVDAGTGREVNVGTRYHVNDLWGMMEDSTVTDPATGTTSHLYRIVKIPAIADDGSLAHPFKLTKEYLERRRQEEISNSGNDLLWWLQYQLEPRASKLISTRAEWVRQCRFDEIGPDAVPVMTVDPAWKGTENAGEGDSASIQVWLLERRGPLVLRYLVDGVHSDMLTSLDGIGEMFRLMGRYGIVHVAPEEHGGHAFRTSLMHEAAIRAVPINIIDLNKTKHKGKSWRIVAFLKEMEAGRVFLCDTLNLDLKEAFLHQYRDYHPQMDHDDALDAAAYTCDPTVAESFAPAWNQALDKARKARLGLGRRPADDAALRRTRYTTL